MSNANPLPRTISALHTIAILIAFVLALIVVRSRNAARQAAGPIDAVNEDSRSSLRLMNARQQRNRMLAQPSQNLTASAAQ